MCLKRSETRQCLHEQRIARQLSVEHPPGHPVYYFRLLFFSLFFFFKFFLKAHKSVCVCQPPNTFPPDQTIINVLEPVNCNGDNFNVRKCARFPKENQPKRLDDKSCRFFIHDMTNQKFDVQKYNSTNRLHREVENLDKK